MMAVRNERSFESLDMCFKEIDRYKLNGGANYTCTNLCYVFGKKEKCASRTKTQK